MHSRSQLPHSEHLFSLTACALRGSNGFGDSDNRGGIARLVPSPRTKGRINLGQPRPQLWKFSIP